MQLVKGRMNQIVDELLLQNLLFLISVWLSVGTLLVSPLP